MKIIESESVDEDCKNGFGNKQGGEIGRWKLAKVEEEMSMNIEAVVLQRSRVVKNEGAPIILSRC